MRKILNPRGGTGEVTNDRGANSTTLSARYITDAVVRIAFPTASEGYVLAPPDQLYRTLGGGGTWSRE
jgi:hypothetical protein